MASNSAVQLQWTEITQFKGLDTRAFRSLLADPASAQVMSGCFPQPGGGLRAGPAISRTVTDSGLGDAAGLTAGDDQILGMHALTRNATGQQPSSNPSLNAPGYWGESTDMLILTAKADTSAGSIRKYNLWFRSLDTRFGTGEPTGGDAAWSRFTTIDFAETSGPIPPSGAGTGRAIQPFFVDFPSALLDSPSAQWDSAGTDGKTALLLDVGGAGDDTGSTNRGGLFQIDSTTAKTFTVLDGSGNNEGPIATHQSRLLKGGVQAIVFSDPLSNAMAVPANNFVIPDADEGFTNTNFVGFKALGAWMVPIPPSDLLFCTSSGRLYNIQGDLTDPLVRELGRWAPSAVQQPVLTPYGVAAIETGLGVALYGPDGSRRLLSPTLDRSTWNTSTLPQNIGHGRLDYYKNLLFVPNQQTVTTLSDGSSNDNRTYGALVYDFDTEAWFTHPHKDELPYNGGSPIVVADNNSTDPALWMLAARSLPGTGGPCLAALSFGNGRNGSVVDPAANSKRSWVFEWTSAPFSDPSGRQLEIREVRVYTHITHVNASITVTVNGTSLTQTPGAVGNKVLVFQFRERAPFLDVTVKSVGVAGVQQLTGNRVDIVNIVEAPPLHKVAVGWQPGHDL